MRTYAQKIDFLPLNDFILINRETIIVPYSNV